MLIIKGQVEMLVGESYNVANTHQIREHYNQSDEGLTIWGINQDQVLTYSENLPQLDGDINRFYDIVLSGAVIIVIGVKRGVYTDTYKQELKEALNIYSGRGIKTMDVVVLEQKLPGLVTAKSDKAILWGV